MKEINYEEVNDRIIGLKLVVRRLENGELYVYIERQPEATLNNREFWFDKKGELVDSGSTL